MAASAPSASKPIHIPSSFGELPSGWSWSRLDDITEGVFDCPHSTPKLTEHGPFVVRTQDIITGAFRTDQAARVSEETYIERTVRVTPQNGDLLYSREGTYFGIAAEVPENTRVCLGQRMVLIRPDSSRLDFRFLRYWLNSPVMASHIHGYRDGTVAERLNLPTIRALPIIVPPLPEQKAIARILGTLDDKIELNRRMNATLEAMARALFQSWFVDFDPVRRNMEAQSHLTSVQAAPNPIPEAAENWFTYAIECQGGSVYIGQTDNLRRRWAQHVDGKGAEWTRTHPPVALVFWETHDSLEKAIAREKWLKSGSGREWLKQEIAARSSVHLPAGEAGAKAALPVGQTGGRQPAGMDPQTAALFPDSFQASELGEIPAGWNVKTIGEILELAYGKPLKEGNRKGGSVAVFGSNGRVGWHDEKLVSGPGIVVGRKGNPGIVTWAHGDFYPIDTTFYAVPVAECRSLYFLYYALSIQNLAHLGADSAVPGLNRNHAYMSKLVIPSGETLEAFNEQIAPIFSKIHANDHQSRTLATLRDTLLPKLLSGDLNPLEK